jgi:hypothetical protein
MSIDDRTALLEEDRARLERRLKRSERGLVVLGSLVVALLTLAALPVDPTIQDVVRAERFEVVVSRSDPRVLVSIGATPAGNGTITTLSDEGRVLVSLRPDAAGRGAVRTFNPDGHLLFSAAADVDGLGTLGVYDGRGYALAGVAAAGDAGSFYLANRKGDRLLEARASDFGSGILRTYHAGGERLISLSQDDAGDGLIVARGRGGRLMAMLGAGVEGGTLGLVDWTTKTVERFGKPLRPGPQSKEESEDEHGGHPTERDRQVP